MIETFEYCSVIERLYLLARRQNISINKALVTCGFKDFIANLRKGSIPSADKFITLASYFDTNVGWLLTGEGDIGRNQSYVNTSDIELVNDFNKLNENEKSLVLERIQTLLDSKNLHDKSTELPIVIKPLPTPPPPDEPEPEKRSIIVFDQKAVAGLGNYLSEDTTYEEIECKTSEIPDKTDFGIRISGDSMEPQISDGSIVWVCSQPEIEDNQIGIFIYNNEAFCKKLKIDYKKKAVYLISLNSKYKPIKIIDGKNLKTVGRVLL